MLGYDLVEVFEVAGLLIVHVLHQWAKMRVSSDYGWSLSLINGNSSKLASLVYAKLMRVKIYSQIVQNIESAYSSIQEAFLFFGQRTLPLP